MSSSQRLRDNETVSLAIGVVLSFLGVVLISLGSLVMEAKWYVVAVAVAVTITGLGLLLRFILRHTSRHRAP